MSRLTDAEYIELNKYFEQKCSNCDDGRCIECIHGNGEGQLDDYTPYRSVVLAWMAIDEIDALRVENERLKKEVAHLLTQLQKERPENQAKSKKLLELINDFKEQLEELL